MAEQLPDAQLPENLPSEGESEEEEQPTGGGWYHLSMIPSVMNPYVGRQACQFRNLPANLTSCDALQMPEFSVPQLTIY